MWTIPSWAVGMSLVIVVIATANVVARRLMGGHDTGRSPTPEDSAALARALEDVTRRLGELEERMDFAERLLAKERAKAQLAPPGE